ncbi:F0F1 ATP synthase subunit alpha [Phaeospirillum tilakii]|uniref:ATP synthase subunit alpha n=1 Tax=Phaeospirillum tilakii TaxID=741673 RepID=A0ABW5CCW1_9PROT
MTELDDDLARWAAQAQTVAAAATLEPHQRERGRVERIGDGVALLSGLAGAGQDEMLRFADGGLGMAVTLAPERIGAVLLSPSAGIAAGSVVERGGAVVRVPVGEALLGRVVDPLGRPLDGRPAPVCQRSEPVERPAPAIVERDPITRPLATGITVLDAMIPIGRGQRELIIGDGKTGKTAIAADAVINQRDSDVICVWASIGQRAAAVNRLIEAVGRFGPRERTLFVIAEASAPPGLAWLTPYAACSMAEHFVEQGRDVLLVIDDLTHHAALHRELSLLLRRPPGREAYPGDIFFAHARLLERGAQRAAALGGGSLTILPIVATQGGNLTAYIPTNIISITDGQIILDPKLFHAGQKPAVDVGLSVSRVGGKAQPPLLRRLAGSLKLDYAQFLELEMFTRFGGMADERTRRQVEHGRRIRALLIQTNTRVRGLPEQAAGLLALGAGLLDPLAEPALAAFLDGLADWLATACPALAARIAATGELDPAGQSELIERLRGHLAALGA